jgi:hypothetical protein
VITVIAEPSIQSLLILPRVNGNNLATATAFIVRRAGRLFLVTNRHVVTGRDQSTGVPLSKTGGLPDEIEIMHNSSPVGRWIGRREKLYSGDMPQWFEHPELKEKADIAALRLTEVTDVELHPYDLDKEVDMLVGPADVVSVIGFPFGHTAGGMFGVWASGFIASEPEVNYDGYPVFLIDCRARPGQSGSAVIAYRSGGIYRKSGGGTNIMAGTVTRFLGVYSGRIHPESDIGMVWKAGAIRELIDAIPA